MTTKHRQLIYILCAFLILALVHFTGIMINLFIENALLTRILSSSSLVINITGVIIGIYDIYQGLALRKYTSLWIPMFVIGIICVWFNAYALAL